MRRGRFHSDAPQHGAVHGAELLGQHCGMSHDTTREHSHAMQNETRQTTPAAAFRRSSIERLPTELREAVDRAIADGATIDEIAARIRAEVEGRPPPPPAPRTVTSAPVDPWDPESFPAIRDNPGESHSIPDNPGESHLSPAHHYESWIEIAPRVYRTSPTSILSLGPAEPDATSGCADQVRA